MSYLGLCQFFFLPCWKRAVVEKPKTSKQQVLELPPMCGTQALGICTGLSLQPHI